MEFESIEEKVIFNKLIANIQDKNNLNSNLTDNFSVNDKYKLDENMNKYMSEIVNNISVLEENRINTSNRYISSSKGKIGVFIKRIIRKLLRWYIEPVCQQQTTFNNAITPIIGRLTEVSNYNATEIQEIKNIINQVNELNKKYDDLEKNNQFINQIINENSEKLEKINELDLPVFNECQNFWNKKTMSQSGEDAIISYILMVLGIPVDKCNYLDLGANHAKDLSNTYYFYSLGARGVIVEANNSLITELKFYRNGDVILNKCISTKSNEIVDFYILSGDGLSTPDKKSAEEFIIQNPQLSIIEVIKVETITVNDIIDTYFGKAPTILNIDIEGKDFEILQSINWNLHRPLIVITEMIDYMPTLVIGNKKNEIVDFMKGIDYEEYAFTGINSIFIDKKYLEGRGA